MDPTRSLLLGFFTVALCKYSQAEWNATRNATNTTVSCSPYDTGRNCTDGNDVHRWSGHFSECPEEYLHYCIHGVCRFVQEQNTPACRCESGYMGTRCEYLDLEWLVGERKEILIACSVAALVILLLVAVFIYISVRRKLNMKRKRKKKNRYEEEKLNAKPDEAFPAAAETSDTNTV